MFSKTRKEPKKAKPAPVVDKKTPKQELDKFIAKLAKGAACAICGKLSANRGAFLCVDCGKNLADASRGLPIDDAFKAQLKFLKEHVAK